jgi:hypothetical protein
MQINHGRTLCWIHVGLFASPLCQQEVLVGLIIIITIIIIKLQRLIETPGIKVPWCLPKETFGVLNSRRKSYRVVNGANHRAEQLGET